MTFKNIFDSSGSTADSAQEAARSAAAQIPGARPEREGVDPELYDGIPEATRDPKIVRETSPEALTLMNTFITPLFTNTRAAGDRQRTAGENPESTSKMASSSKDEAFKKVHAQIKDEDRPEIGDEEREKLKGKTQQSSGATKKGAADHG